MPSAARRSSHGHGKKAAAQVTLPRHRSGFILNFFSHGRMTRVSKIEVTTSVTRFVIYYGSCPNYGEFCNCLCGRINLVLYDIDVESSNSIGALRNLHKLRSLNTLSFIHFSHFPSIGKFANVDFGGRIVDTLPHFLSSIPGLLASRSVRLP